MNDEAIYNELRLRIQENLDYFNQQLPRDFAIAWRGYCAALLEWSVISVPTHDKLWQMLPDIEDDPVTIMMIGRPEDLEQKNEQIHENYPMNPTTMYVALLDEGVDCWRPTQAEWIRDDVYYLLPTPNYDLERERWEFLPYSLVRCKPRISDDGQAYLTAYAQNTDHQLAIKIELRGRIQEDLDYFNQELPRDFAIAWRGYLASLLEWAVIEIATHDFLWAMLPDITDDPVSIILSGRPEDIEQEE